MNGTHAFWYLSRASGFTALVLLALATAMGLVMAGGFKSRTLGRWFNTDLHQYVSLLALGFTVFHVLVLLGDPYYSFGLQRLLTPFALPYRRLWTGLGALALWGLLLFYGSLYARPFIGYRAWRIIHYLTPLPLVLAVVHGLAAGTDTSSLWGRVLIPVAAALPLAALAYRLARGMPRPARRRLVMAAGAAVVTLGVGTLGLVAAGARLAPRSPASPSTAPASASSLSPLEAILASGQTTSIQEDINGRFDQSSDQSNASLRIDATGDGDIPLRLQVQLVLQRQAAQQASQVVTNTVDISDSNSGAAICHGQLTSLDEDFIALACQGSDGGQAFSLTLQGRLNALRDGSIAGAMSGDVSRSG